MGVAVYSVCVLIVTLIVVVLTISAYNQVMPLIRHDARPDENLERIARSDFTPHTAAIVCALIILAGGNVILIYTKAARPYMAASPEGTVGHRSAPPGQYASIVATLALAMALVTAISSTSNDAYARGSGIITYLFLMIVSMAVMLYIGFSLLSRPTAAAGESNGLRP